MVRIPGGLLKTLRFPLPGAKEGDRNQGAGEPGQGQEGGGSTWWPGAGQGAGGAGLYQAAGQGAGPDLLTLYPYPLPAPSLSNDPLRSPRRSDQGEGRV